MFPVAYYLDDENELRDSFKENDIIPKLSEEGYRSIHYIVTYKNYYLQIQLRPLYMEQWCMCSHNYVYKKEGYKNYNFLNNMSLILSGVIDLSGEIGDFMKDIYNGKYILQQSVNSYYMNKDGINSIDKMIEMCNNSVQDLLKLKERIELQE